MEPALVGLDMLDCLCWGLFSASNTALRVTGGLEVSDRPGGLVLIREGGGIDPSLGALPDKLAVRNNDDEDEDELRVTGSLLGDCAPTASFTLASVLCRLSIEDCVVSISEGLPGRLI